MGRANSMIDFVNRYAHMAGRTCCAGRSWVGLDRSLARRAGETTPGSCEPPDFDASADPDEVAGAAAACVWDEPTVAEPSVPEPEKAPAGGP